jgi:hypothetical protein
MKKSIISSLLIFAFSIWFLGCGGGSSSTNNNQNEETLTYSWSTSAWSECSGNCGTDNAIQTRTVTCKDSNATTVSDEYCTSAKPSLSQSCTASECLVNAVTSLNSNWEQETIFSADILYPKGILKDNKDNIYTYSTTSAGTNIAKLSSDNTLELVLSTSSFVSGLGFQTKNNKFIYTNEISSLYSLDLQGNQTLLKSFGVMGNKIAVANDDSFYTCTSANGLGLYHYDENGNKLSTIVDSINVCSSLALNPGETKLYYTSSYDGTVNEVDLQTNSVTTVANNLGIPGTTEPITIAFNNDGDLYLFPAASGLYKYENGQFNKTVDSISGAGDIVWSEEHGSFLMGAGASANIVAYNTQTLLGTDLTPYLNAFTIAQTGSGKILTCNNQTSIEKVNAQGFSTFMNLEDGCAHLATDSGNNIYMGATNGKILAINDINLSYEEFADFSSEGIVHLTYDSYNNALISIHNIGNSSAEVWKTPLSNPGSASKVYTLTNVTVNNNLPVAASDNNGNTYILERTDNKIYKLNITTATLSEFYDAPLDSEAITVPDMIYLSTENALLISTIEDYQMITLDTKVKSHFALNNGSVDNFAMHINTDNEIVSIHSGQLFKMTNK